MEKASVLSATWDAMCSDQEQAHSDEKITAKRRILLLPGIWMPASSMRFLGKNLALAGFEPQYASYSAILGGPAKALPSLKLRLRDVDAVVAHSLGGLMVLSALRDMDCSTIQHVVCLGSPLNGSEAAKGLNQKGMAWLAGASAHLLMDGIGEPWPLQPKVGLIAGSSGWGLGRILGIIGPNSDGTVGVEETRWPGLTDHLCLPLAHTRLLTSNSVSKQVAHFLNQSQFFR